MKFAHGVALAVHPKLLKALHVFVIYIYVRIHEAADEHVDQYDDEQVAEEPIDHDDVAADDPEWRDGIGIVEGEDEHNVLLARPMG